MSSRRLAPPAYLVLSAAVVLLAPRATMTAPAQGLTISAHARAIQPGEIVRLSVSCACTSSQRPGTARVLDQVVPLAPAEAGAWSGLIGLDVDTAPGAYPVNVVVELLNAPPLTGTYTLTVTSKQFPTRQLRVAPSYVDPPPAELARILAEAARLDALFKRTTWRDRVGPFQSPVGVAARPTFGARSVFNGQARSPHAGVDFGSPAGTRVVAPAAAEVALA